MKAFIETRVRQHFEYTPEIQGEQLVHFEGTAFRIEVSDGLDISPFVDEEGYPTTHGHQVTEDILIRGLMSNLHLEKDRHGIDLAARFRKIIAEMEEQLIEQGDHVLIKEEKKQKVIMIPISAN